MVLATKNKVSKMANQKSRAKNFDSRGRIATNRNNTCEVDSNSTGSEVKCQS